jgi:N-acetylneuraminic acid mutarotase
MYFWQRLQKSTLEKSTSVHKYQITIHFNYFIQKGRDSFNQKNKPVQKNHRHFTQVIIAILLVSQQSCHCKKPVPTTPPLATGDWIRQAEVDGIARAEAVSFTIGDTAYLGTGWDGTNRLADLWGYSAASNSWTQRANFPGAARNSAVAFAIGTKGYVGTGFDGNNMLSDFYQFNQATNTWNTIAPFGGSARYNGVAFGIGNYGYVATGYDSTYQNDFWLFDPSAGPKGAWTKKTNFAGQGRSAALALVYGTKAYIVTGTHNGQECGDFWYYDAVLDVWVQLRNIYNSNTSQTYDDNYTDIERDNAVGFVIGDYAYITTGENWGSLIQSTWGYNFAQDLWVRRSPFEGAARQGAVGFFLAGYGYVSTGQSGTQFHDDLIQFNPNKTLNTNDF